MAVGRGEMLHLPQPDDSGYLSEESDFYGNEATREELEHRAAIFDAKEWWQHKTPSMTEIGDQGVSRKMERATATLYNFYEGVRYRSCARQLEETVEEFLARLPPATTRVSFSPWIPWIFIGNPYRKAPAWKPEKDVKGDLGEEGPPEEDRDLEKFIFLGKKLLGELSSIKHGIEVRTPRAAKASITRAVNVEKEKIVQKILDTATELHVTSGKWMMFCPSNEVNAVWSVVARATAQNDLGIAAKVAPEDGGGKDRLICVYTKDFNDLDDVNRVIRKMKNFGLAESRKTLYYKCDAYTYLGLNSGNEYNIKASYYNSADVLAGPTGHKGLKKLGGLLKKKKEDSGDWLQLEQW